MKIIKANKTHKTVVLELLDEFRTVCARIENPATDFVSTTARDNGSPLFDKVISSSDSAIFLAHNDDRYIGIVTVHKIPLLRRGVSCAEVEEMFVKETFWGEGIAQKLMNAVIEWARNENLNSVRLDSGEELQRAHHFYEKVGFKKHGIAYEIRLD